MVNFETSKVIKVDFLNERVEKDGPFDINSTFNTSVNYDDENKKCVCVYETYMESPDEKVDFKFEFKILGFFSYEGEDKKKIHVEAMQAFYPYVQTSVMNLMSAFGYPNFMLPKLVLSEEDVNI